MIHNQNQNTQNKVINNFDQNICVKIIIIRHRKTELPHFCSKNINPKHHKV